MNKNLLTTFANIIAIIIIICISVFTFSSIGIIYC